MAKLYLTILFFFAFLINCCPKCNCKCKDTIDIRRLKIGTYAIFIANANKMERSVDECFKYENVIYGDSLFKSLLNSEINLRLKENNIQVHEFTSKEINQVNRFIDDTIVSLAELPQLAFFPCNAVYFSLIKRGFPAFRNLRSFKKS